MDGMITAGRLERPDDAPVTGAAVHAIFRGDPTGGCGTVLDLERAPAHTDASGQFRITFPDPDEMLRPCGPPGVRRRGGFLVVGVKDGRTIGYTVASGEELGSGPVRLTALATTTLGGRVVDDDGHAVAGAAVESDHYFRDFAPKTTGFRRQRGHGHGKKRGPTLGMGRPSGTRGVPAGRRSERRRGASGTAFPRRTVGTSENAETVATKPGGLPDGVDAG